MRLFIYVTIAGLACSCGKPTAAVKGDEHFHEYPSELSASEFVDWKKTEKQLTGEHRSEEMTFKVCYQPAEWLALKSLGYDANAEAISKEAENYQDLMYFTLRLQLNSAQTELLKYKSKDNREYQERVNYYSFKVQKDIRIVVDGKDTLPCNISHFERAFNVTNYADLMLGFSKEELNKVAQDWKTITIVFNDKIFGNGTIAFQFERKQLSNTPKLKAI
ncbi:MAG TPA: hypothetical protein VD905_20650 [Flavobacteriales bacterium]|nr:hypothetical protein [Flavobacteriales bacterium]